MPVELNAIGTGQAHSTVSIESQVAGIVSAVHYTQGQFVEKGELLASLDDRPFEAALQLAQANLAKDKANLALAERGSGTISETLSIWSGAKRAAG